MFGQMEKNETMYEEFFSNFGRYIKVGMIEDSDNKDELARLSRW